MNNEISITIVQRFFKAIEEIIAKKELRGIQTFTNAYLIDKRNFYKVKNNPDSNIFQVAWLSYLVNDFNVSSRWLLTGKDTMFNKN